MVAAGVKVRRDSPRREVSSTLFGTPETREGLGQVHAGSLGSHVPVLIKCIHSFRTYSMPSVLQCGRSHGAARDGIPVLDHRLDASAIQTQKILHPCACSTQ